MSYERRQSVLSLSRMIPLLLLAGCSVATHVEERLASAVGSSSPRTVVDASQLSLEEERGELTAILKHDLARLNEREAELRALVPPRAAVDESASTWPRRSAREILSSLVIPVVGLAPRDLSDNFGQPRDGGKRRHRGIDIFAPKGTEIVAVTDGYISYIGTQPKGGRCVWLVSEEGVAFYYAHLDRWAPGLYEGMQVKRGDLIGYVGNTGNAIKTPPHLHFAVLDADEALDPYPILTRAERVVRARPLLAGGFSGGSQ